MSPSKLGRRAATRAVVATGAAVALASGGIALAGTGHLPTLPDSASDTATASVSKPRPTHTTQPTETPTETATETPTETPSETPTEAPTTAQPTTAPRPNLEGLCKAYLKGKKGEKTHGKALDSAAFTALATAAGGKEGIATYCVELIGSGTSSKQTGRPTDKPSPKGKANGLDKAGEKQAGEKQTGKKQAGKKQAGRPTDRPTPPGQARGHKKS